MKVDDKIVGIIMLCIVAIIAILVLREQAKDIVLTISGAVGGSITGDLKKKLGGGE